MDLRRFYIADGIVKLKTHKITIRKYYNTKDQEYDVTETEEIGTEDEPKGYDTIVDYVTDDELTEWTVNYIPKHKLYEVESIETFDNSKYAWMEGLRLRTNNWKQEISDMLKCGSLEAYKASLPEAQNELMLDMGVEIAMLKLGINEEV